MATHETSEQQDRQTAARAAERAGEAWQAAIDDQTYATQATEHKSDCWGTAALNWRLLAAKAEAAARACEAMRVYP